jgi:hypothetical protein
MFDSAVTSNKSGDAMSAEVIQHIDIEVMKSEMAAIRELVQHVGAKMDVVLQMQITLTQLQERTDTQRSALDRAFGAISDIKNQVASVATEQTRWAGFVKGGALVGAILFTFVQWYTLQQITKLEETAKSFSIIDRRIMVIESKIWPDPPAGGAPNR